MTKIHNHGHKMRFPFLTVGGRLEFIRLQGKNSPVGIVFGFRPDASTVIMDTIFWMKLFYSLFGEAFKFYLNLFQRSEKNRFNFKKQISFFNYFKSLNKNEQIDFQL